MFLQFVSGIISLANAFIALFIVVYALLFLKKTKSHRERRPWDYLFVASTIYLLYTLLAMILQIYEVHQIWNLDVYELTIFFQFIYTGLILLAFISQTDLIFKNEIIIITRKLDDDEKKTLESGGSAEIIIKKEEKKIEEEVEKKVKEDLKSEYAAGIAANIVPEQLPIKPKKDLTKKPRKKKPKRNKPKRKKPAKKKRKK